MNSEISGIYSHKNNPGIEFDKAVLDIKPISENSLQRRARILELSRLPYLIPPSTIRAAWLLRTVTCIDLTTLAGDDTEANVRRLCIKAIYPIHQDILVALGLEDFGLRCGAVCVYPARVKDAAEVLRKANSDLPIASATGFPAGQTCLTVRCQEIKYAVESGATEIDIVINRKLAITGSWEDLYKELKEMRTACGEAHMKAILAVGELPDSTCIYKAAMVAMMAGADFIKTSTGKETVNATIPFGLVMCRAIRDYYERTGIRIGLKPAGGIRVAADALNWLILIKEELGTEWLNNKLFRIGASGLLGDVEKELFTIAFQHPPPRNWLSPA